MSEVFDSFDKRRWIDPALDGSGGGYGKFKGQPVVEIAKLFRQIGSESNMRSVTGILRIAYEQLEVRSHLSGAIWGVYAMAPVAIGLGVASIFYEGQTRTTLLKAFGIAGLLCAGFLYGAVSTLRDSKAAKAQEQAIAEMTVIAVEDLVARPDFKMGSLDSQQRLTLKRAMKVAKSRSVVLQSLID